MKMNDAAAPRCLVRGACLLLALAPAACASSSGRPLGDAAAVETETIETVQVTIINEFVGTATAYTHWETRTGRTRIAVVGQGRTRLIDTPVRGDELSIELEFTMPPPSTAGPNRLATAAGGADPSNPKYYTESVPVMGGDALEVRISAGGVLTVRRLEAGF
jgi:hypothetical protein